MKLEGLIISLGIITYLTAIITIISGARRMDIKLHKTLALITIVLATLHAAIVIFVELF